VSEGNVKVKPRGERNLCLSRERVVNPLRVPYLVVWVNTQTPNTRENQGKCCHGLCKVVSHERPRN
jgi:hypothetical protein